MQLNAFCATQYSSLACTITTVSSNHCTDSLHTWWQLGHKDVTTNTVTRIQKLEHSNNISCWVMISQCYQLIQFRLASPIHFTFRVIIQHTHLCFEVYIFLQSECFEFISINVRIIREKMHSNNIGHYVLFMITMCQVGHLCALYRIWHLYNNKNSAH